MWQMAPEALSKGHGVRRNVYRLDTYVCSPLPIQLLTFERVGQLRNRLEPTSYVPINRSCLRATETAVSHIGGLRRVLCRQCVRAEGRVQEHASPLAMHSVNDAPLQKTREVYKTQSRVEYVCLGLRRGGDGACQSANEWIQREVMFGSTSSDTNVCCYPSILSLTSSHREFDEYGSVAVLASEVSNDIEVDDTETSWISSL